MGKIVPFTENYVIGSGSLYFIAEGQTGGVPLGNTPGFNIGVEAESFTHNESSTSLKATDLTVPISSTISSTIECDSITTTILGLIFGSQSETVTQTASAVTGEVIAGVSAGRLYQLGRTESAPMGIQRATAVTLALTGVTRVDSTVYGAGAQIVVSSKIYRTNAGGTTAASAPSFTSSAIGDTTTDGGVTWVYIAATASLTVDTDYKLDPIPATFAAMTSGKIATALTVCPSVSVTAAYTPTAGTRTRISSGSGSVAKGELRFYSDNTVGTNTVVVFPLCTLSASGELPFISEEPATVSFAVGATKKNSLIPLLFIDGVQAA